MEIYRSLEALASLPRDTALAIGNFDGLHLGHRRILGVLAREARARRLPPGVLTFSPHPEKVFGPQKIVMIQTLEQRLDGLSRLGVSATIVLPFNRAVSGLSPRAFVSKILAKELRARLIVVGPDFRFGKDRRGDVAALRELGGRFGIEVRAVLPVRKGSAVVSSSRIRELLGGGDIETANALLGRPYSIEGDVGGGDARGRRLGFPTANIQTPNEILPPGVFITLTKLEGGAFPSITNIGTRPTFADGGRKRRRGEPRVRVETHILGFDRKIYGTSLTIHFLKKIREERAFAGAGELAARIAKDRDAALEYFRGIHFRIPPGSRFVV